MDLIKQKNAQKHKKTEGVNKKSTFLKMPGMVLGRLETVYCFFLILSIGLLKLFALQVKLSRAWFNSCLVGFYQIDGFLFTSARLPIPWTGGSSKFLEMVGLGFHWIWLGLHEDLHYTRARTTFGSNYFKTWGTLDQALPWTRVTALPREAKSKVICWRNRKNCFLKSLWAWTHKSAML